MKINVIDENNFILFIINKNIIPELDESVIAEYLKNLFLKMKSQFDIEIYGYYDVYIYVDKFYGMILKMIREESEYLSYYSKQIEMKIVISNNAFLYKIDDLFSIDERILNKSNIYYYNDNFYIELSEKLDFVLLGDLIEKSELIFENTENIKELGEKIELR